MQAATFSRRSLWKGLFSELKIQHTTTPPYNLSSNPVERFHRTIIAILRTRGDGVQDDWDPWINSSVFAYNTTGSCSIGVTPQLTLHREENDVSMERRHVRRKTARLQEHESSARRKSEEERADVQTPDPEHQSGVSSMVF